MWQRGTEVPNPDALFLTRPPQPLIGFANINLRRSFFPLLFEGMAFERLRSGSSWEVVVSNNGGLPKVPLTSSLPQA